MTIHQPRAATQADLRRRIAFLLCLLGCAAALPGAPTFAAGRAAAKVLFTVATGDVNTDSVVVWAQSAAVGGQIRFEVAPAEGGPGEALPPQVVAVTDAFVPVKARFSGLRAGTRYEARVTEAATNTTRTAKFTTPAPVGTRTGLRFGVSGDWRQDLLPYPAIRNAPDQGLAFFVALGDTIYADVPSADVPARQARSLAEMRAKHAENFTDRAGLNTWPLVRASMPLYAMIDDHEVTNDFAGGAPINTDRRFAGSGPLIHDSELYRNGLQAFTEYYPIEDLRYPPGDPATAGLPDLYRYRTFGSDAALFLLDARTFRDTPLPAIPIWALTNRDAITRYQEASFAANRTLLGKAQFGRLIRDLQAAQQAGVRWKFIFTPEPIQNLGVLNASDRWEGYQAERTALLKFINENEIANVVFVTADFHGTIVNDVTYQEGVNGANYAANGAWEIITGPVAYAEPFGPTVFNLVNAAGLVKPEEAAQYRTMPIPQQDQVIERLVNAQLEFYGYNPIGLGDAALTAPLIKGSWVAVHTYGWTEFDIDAETQRLTVTTYGVPWYDGQAIQTDVARISALQPQAIQQFSVEAR
jgi:3-phytase/alkaline phosphatase D